jgi:acyl-homoserine lactone synthase
MLKIMREKDDPALMERVWAFRHHRFVEQLGWEELRRSDGRERDEFDTGQTYHAVLVDGGHVIGYSRLIRTTQPHLTNDFCVAANVEIPSGEFIFEWSRCAIARGAPRNRGHSAANLLMTGVLECLLELEAQRIVFLTYPVVTTMMRRRGYPVQRHLGFELANGDRIEAVSSAISPQLLLRHRQKHCISASLTCWEPYAFADRRKQPTAA